MAQHAFSNGSLFEPLPATSTVRTEHNEVCFPGVRVQDDNASGIAMLFDSSNWNPGAFRTLAQTGETFDPFLGMPREGVVGGDRVKDVELGSARTRYAERAVHRVETGLGEVDRAQDQLERGHFQPSSPRTAISPKLSGFSGFSGDLFASWIERPEPSLPVITLAHLPSS
jgi:hypothetical protein